MQAILCGCERHLEATDFERLMGEMLDHLRLEHPKVGLGESQVQTVREIVAACSYRFEWVNCEWKTPDRPLPPVLNIFRAAGGRAERSDRPLDKLQDRENA